MDGIVLDLEMGNLQDYSGNTVTPTGTTQTFDMLNRYQRARSFNGTTDQIQVSNPYEIGTGEFSINFWIKAGTINDFDYMMSNFDTGTVNNFFLIQLVSNTVRVYMDNGSATTLDASTLVNDSAWHMISVTRDSSDLVSVYIDGNSENSTTKAGDLSNNDAWYIGARYNSANEYNGDMSEVGVWNRGLSATEVYQLYSGVKSNYQGLFDGCVGYWDFKKDAKDLISQNDGTVTGAALSTNRFNYSGGYLFNGSSDFISVADSTDFSFTDGSGTDKAFSISTWVNFDDVTDTRVINKATASNWEWEVYINSSDILYVYCYNPTVTAYIFKYSNAAITSIENTWAHIVVTYDGSEASSGFTLYLNGSAIAATTGSAGSYSGMTNTTSPVTIGKVYTNAGYLDGDLGDTLVWKDRELTSDEVKQLYDLTSKKYIYPYMKAIDQ